MLFVLSRDFEVMVSANNMGDSMPYYDDIHKENIQAGTGSYEFKIPLNHENSRYVTEGNYVVRTDHDGNYLMFTIMSMTETHGDTSYKTVYAENSGMELLNEISLNYPMETVARDIKYYINRDIANSGWEIGYCDVGGTRTLEFSEYENVLSRLLKIAGEFDNAEISFSVELAGSKVKRRMVNINRKRGENNGKRFVYSKDITNVNRSVDLTEVATSLLGVGRTDTNDVKTTFKTNTYDDGNIYTTNGSEYIHSRYALERWGQVAGAINRVFSFDTDNSTELLNRAITDLKKRENPSVTYEVEVAMLHRITGYEHEKVRLGDTIKVIDYTFIPELLLEARILEKQVSYTDPSKDKVVLGNYQLLKSDISQELRDLQSKLLEREATWETIGETIYKAMLAPQNPEVNDLWLDTTSEPNKLKRWDGAKWVLAGVYDPDQLGVYDKDEVDQMLDFNEWYAGVKAGTNLIQNVTNTETANGYEWVDAISNNGVMEKVLSRKHTGGNAISNYRFTIGRINVDPTKTYLLEFYIQAKDSNSRYWYGIEEFTADDLDNDTGNHPYIVNNRIPSEENVGIWKKHFALIPPHYAGLENSHDTQQSLYTNETEYKFWNVNTSQIELKVYLVYNPTNPAIDSEMLATGFSLYEVGSSDTLYGEIGSLSDTVGQINSRTSDIEIVKTVTTSPDFESIMSDKANAEDITDMATGKMVSDSYDNAVDYVDGRLDGEGGINEAINAVSSELSKTASAINAKFTSSGGVNKIMNSLGFAGIDFWTVLDEIGIDTMQTLQNQDLELLGFGSGFYSPQGEKAVIEQKVNTAREKEFALSFWIKKNKDSGVNANAGVEVIMNNEIVAFAGKLTGELASDYELAIYKFTTEYNEITIRVTIDEGAEAIISGLMLNAGTEALQWQHHYTEIYNTNIQFNLNGLKVLSGNYRGYTIVSPQEFSGYYETVNEQGQPEMQRVFTLNKDTTEVTKIDIDEEIITKTIKIVPIKSATINGLAFVPYE